MAEYLGVARPLPSTQPFYKRVPKGGFFFAGSLVEDSAEVVLSSTEGRNSDTAIAATMAEVADIEKAEKDEAHARALKEEPVKQGRYHF